MTNDRPTKTSRRRFLAAGAAAVAPLILPEGVLGAPGRPGANDRVVTGHIGIGGMGRAHLDYLRDRCGAICDVDANHLARARGMLGRNVFATADYRRVLDRKDIDAVVISTPDHWHAVQTVHACQAGKDVYVEKPACKTLAQGAAMVDAARRYARVVQVGSQGRSTDGGHAACTYIRNGQLGRVRRIVCWHPDNPAGGDPARNGPPPPELDWELWLGPAHWVPYNPDRVHTNFRWMLDFGGGQIRDRGAHVLSLAAWCLDLEPEGTVTVTATGETPRTGLWDCPLGLEVTWEFSEPELTIVWSQPGERAAAHPFGAVYHGESGTLIVSGGDGYTSVEEHARDFTPPPGGVSVPRSMEHRENWLECIRTRKRPIMDIADGCRVAELCTLGNLAFRLGRPLTWDFAAREFAGDPQAQRLASRPGRDPWRL